MGRWVTQAQIWRFVCLTSSVIGLICYGLSSSFILLFGNWNLLKILSYSVFSFAICLAVWFAKVCQHSHSMNLICKAHLSVMVLTVTSVYSFFYDKQVNTKPDAFSLISCASFAIMSLSLSTQIHLGFEVDLLYFFLGCFILQLMKIKLLLAIVGASFSYSLVILRSSLKLESSDYALDQVVIDSLQVQPNPGTDISLFMPHSGQSHMQTLLKYNLVACAQAIADSDLLAAEIFIVQLREVVSVSGVPMQRLGAYMMEGLVARLENSGSKIYKALKCYQATKVGGISYMHMLHQICLNFKFGYMCANGAIAQAMKGEDKIHIIDFQIGEGSQWLTLIQDFAARPGGPPHIRITGIDDSKSADALQMVGNKLSKLAEDFKVPFEFHAAPVSACDVELENLGVRSGEALAVNFAFMLHHIPDESVSTQNHRDRLLRLVKSLSPKVVTLVEQESNTNTAPFFSRFLETLDYYTAMFESIDVTLPRNQKERISIEQHCLARDIVNIIACEGAERVERHELFGKWRSRFSMAGFTPYPLSSLLNDDIKHLLKNYSASYRVQERDGAVYMDWKNRALVASSAWK
ncbi:Scarecrow-like transcription factor PAT1, partial [Mucuna pruriens]